ncbi:hypothetical protein SAMN02745171_00093 [Porphyromonas circumdentaria]|uniref:Uncharacterized protein n=1 Tax=Porphyromonas circumdentaria TaxID=29524 RepID=A0A1T4KKZ0_9PORP|nr:hypothetical protein [Porphyromonas circumdentaria]SJZ43066.1 hypothetical protein SAMN02745171_00093 [Porphyromonas circumdentaria]
MQARVHYSPQTLLQEVGSVPKPLKAYTEDVSDFVKHWLRIFCLHPTRVINI